MLTAEQIANNYKELRNIINSEFPTRKKELNEMYNALEEDDRIQMAPASSYEFFHNAFPGGYVDHVLRVYDFALETFNHFKNLGLKVDNFTEEELKFAAIHHDLGKLGLVGIGREHYIWEDEKWWRENRGRMYKSNPNNPTMSTNDMTMQLLSHFRIPVSITEQLGIKLTDGMFDEENKKYYAGFDLNTKLRVNLPYILHHADIMAYRFEFEKWANESGKFKFENSPIPVKTRVLKANQNNQEEKLEHDLSDFEAFFKNK